MILRHSESDITACPSHTLLMLIPVTQLVESDKNERTHTSKKWPAWQTAVWTAIISVHPYEQQRKS